jgi:hypothetical protein
MCASVDRGGNEIRRCAASNAGQQANSNRLSSLLLHVLHKEQEEIVGKRVCSSAQASTGGDPGVDRTNPIRKDLCGCIEFFSNRFCCGCSRGQPTHSQRAFPPISSPYRARRRRRPGHPRLARFGLRPRGHRARVRHFLRVRPAQCPPSDALSRRRANSLRVATSPSPRGPHSKLAQSPATLGDELKRLVANVRRCPKTPLNHSQLGQVLEGQ